MIEKKEIGKRIKTFRQSKGLKQKDLAQSLGIARSYLSRIEGGNILPPSSIFLKLKEQFNISISIDFLLTGEGSPQEAPMPDDDLKYLLAYCTENQRTKHAVLSYFFEYLEKNQASREGKVDKGLKTP